MTAPYLPPGGVPLAQMKVDRSWTAVSVPSVWGGLVVDVLGEQGGPVMEDPALRLLTWPLPPGGGASWPDAGAAAITWHGPGALLVMPGLGGYHDGTRWLRPPIPGRLFTDPDLLRAAIEFVAGPLEDAARLGPLTVCRYCGTPTRDAVVVEEFAAASGAGYQWHACRRCWLATLHGEDGRHLHVVKAGPL